MVKFIVDKKKKLQDFLDIAVCKGTVRYTSKNKSIDKPFFPAFNLVAKDDTLSVLAIDPYRKKTRAKFTLKDVEVQEEGEVPITDYDALNKVLKQRGMPDKDLVFESDNGSVIKLYDKNADHSYTIRARDSKYIKLYGKSDISKKIDMWNELHTFQDDGLLVLNHPKQGKIPYPLKLKVNKDQLLNVIDDAEKLTYDDKTRLVYNEDGLFGMKGKANSKYKSKHRIRDIENLTGTILNFDEKFYYIQTVIPNLFDTIIFNIRKMSAGVIYLYIESENKDQSIRAEIGWTSIIIEDEE